MKPSLFLALAALGLVAVTACGGDFTGVVESDDGGVVSVRDAAPADTGSPTPDGGVVVVSDAGTTRPDAGPKDAGPVDAGAVPGYKWACSSNVAYYGNGSNGQGYGTEVGCNTGKASYCDVAQEASACDPNVDRGDRHYLCSDCFRSSQQNGGWFVPAQACSCKFY